jgi:hypothetical protein
VGTELVVVELEEPVLVRFDLMDVELVVAGVPVGLDGHEIRFRLGTGGNLTAWSLLTTSTSWRWRATCRGRVYAAAELYLREFVPQ